MAERALAVAPMSLHGRVVPLGAGLLMAAFVTDWFYWRTVNVQWETFSVWLLTGGLILAGLSGLALAVDAAVRRDRRIAPLRFLLFTAAALLALINAFVHSRDGYTAVVPSGITLSAVTAVLLLLAGVGGWEVQRPAASVERR